MNLLNDECRSIKRRGILLLVFLMLLCLFPFSGAMGAEQEAWPEDLTLSYALAQASGKHPTLQIASSNVDQARALLRGVDAQTRLQSQLSARLRWVDPPAIALDQSQDDHRLSLSIDKPLYDFGRSSAQLAAGNAAILSAQQRFQDAQNQHRIAILAAFFEVILADLAYARDNEDMSMGYVRLDRARQRNELGQLSDIELLAARSEYQTMRVQRYRSSSAQRSTRAHLANVLNRPGQLPAELQLPRLTVLQRSIPEDVDAWLTEAEQNNALLSAYQLRVKQAHEQLNVARASDNPSLSANAEISRHSRETSGRDNWRAGV
ncbi:TolC family protein, partial [Beggiatoa alba]|nr:TolC family protein [Beggiatoa alba]